MLPAMDTTRITQTLGVLILGALLVVFAIQMVGDAMWRDLGREFVRLSVS